MARPVRKTVKEVPLAEVKDDFSRYLQGGRGSGDSDHAPRQAGGHSDRLRV